MKASHKKNMKHRLLPLCLSFLKIGTFTFGGGYAMIPLIAKEIVDKYQWITDEEMLDIFSVAECTPGVIAINCATFVGYRVAGFWGALLSTLCVSLPAFFIICIISLFLESFKNLQWVAYAFKGIRIGIILLLAMAVFKIGRTLTVSIFSITIVIGAFLVSALTNINTIFILLGAIVIGIFYNILRIKMNDMREKS
jgi:chromate transporter